MTPNLDALDDNADELGRITHSQEHVKDERIGYVSKVSCGTFDDELRFETAHTWLYEPGCRFNELSYLGDVRPPGFRVSLEGNGQDDPPRREWMEFHEINIQGLIFEMPADHNLGVVYFVLYKPPQFYQQTAPTETRGHSLVTSRISYPSSLLGDPDDDISICGVPWIIHYSRVFKVEYRRLQDFSPSSFVPRFTKDREDPLFCFEYQGIVEYQREAQDMASTIRSNLEKISTMCLAGLAECQLGVVKLLYNCNATATSPNIIELVDRLIGHAEVASKQQSRVYNEILNRMARDMDTNHARALRTLHLSALSTAPFTGQVVIPKTMAPLPSFPRMAYVTHFDEKEIAAETERQVQKSLSSGSFEVLVYPSHVEIEGPIDLPINSITDKYRHVIGRFIRVKFVDNNGEPLRVEPGANLRDILEHRVVPILTNESQLFPQVHDLAGYEFLGYSMSSLKKRKAVYFFQHQDSLNAKKIRDQIGTWDIKQQKNKKLAYHASKWGARVSLAFTESIPVVSLSETDWKVRPDYPPGQVFPNTDGCGLISPELCDTINSELAPYGFASSRAFQIRFGGVKGVVYAGEKSLLAYEGTQYKMLLRDSQLKFQVPKSESLCLRIVSTAGESPQSLFFPSALKAFEDSGANTSIIEEIYATAYAHLTSCSSEGLDILWQIFWAQLDDTSAGVEARYGFLKLAIRLKQHGIHPRNYQNSFLTEYLVRLAEKTCDEDLFKIPIPGSLSVLGLTDDYQFLRPGEVFIRVKGMTIQGPVLIYRDPIIHIGDIQQATALDEEILRVRITEMHPEDRSSGDQIDALMSMDNVIFFSQKDNPPLPNCLSGGDLDGDRFEVLTKDCRFWNAEYQISTPDSYSDDGPVAPTGDRMSPSTIFNSTTPFDIKQVAEFIGHYIQNNCFAELQSRHLALADQTPSGMNDDRVKKMAKWLSRAVDYAKSGEAVDIAADVLNNPDFNVEAKPDFLRAVNRNGPIDSRGEYYESSSLLGRIYRNFESIEYTMPIQINAQSIRGPLFEAWGGVLQNPEYADLNDLKLKINRRTLRELDRFRNSNDYPDVYSSEVTMFLRKQRDDFPTSFIEGLMNLVIEAMDSCGIVVLNCSNTPRLEARPHGDYSRDAVERIYKLCLLQAWDVSASNVEAIQYSEDSMVLGHGYPWLCLYTLYCREVPIE